MNRILLLFLLTASACDCGPGSRGYRPPNVEDIATPTAGDLELLVESPDDSISWADDRLAYSPHGDADITDRDVVVLGGEPVEIWSLSGWDPEAMDGLGWFSAVEQRDELGGGLGFSLIGRGIGCSQEHLACFWADYDGKSKLMGYLGEPNGWWEELPSPGGLWPMKWWGKSRSDGYLAMDAVFHDFDYDGEEDLIVVGQHSRLLVIWDVWGESRAEWFGEQREYVSVTASEYLRCVYLGVEDEPDNPGTGRIACYLRGRWREAAFDCDRGTDRWVGTTLHCTMNGVARTATPRI